MEQQRRVGIVLSGGGARGAYQTGALQAIAEVAEEEGVRNPFEVVSGTSAGAINAAALATGAHDPLNYTKRLRGIWENLSSDMVFEVSAFSALRAGARWILELASGGYIGKKRDLALLETSPLHKLLEREFDWQQLQENIDNDLVHFLAITAVNYADGTSRTFYQSNYPYEPWERIRRSAEPTKIAVDHIMASTAIPFLFPPKQLGKWYFGDGSLRNHTPLSPAIKGGADKLLVIGVRKKHGDEEPEIERPSHGRIFSVLLNSLFLDALDLDIERLERINQTLKYVPATAPTVLRPIPSYVIRPSQDIGQIALEEAHHMPRVTRWLMRGLGSPAETAGLISYLLFESPYTRRLAHLGYEDVMRDRARLAEFLVV